MHLDDTLTRVSRHRLGAMALAGALALTAAAAAPTIVAAQDDATVSVSTATDDLGTYLVGPEGRTLYYFTRDVTPGQSVCFGGCLEAWPPLLVGEGQELVGAEGVTGTLGAAPRDDGTMQLFTPLVHFQQLGKHRVEESTGFGGCHQVGIRPGKQVRILLQCHRERLAL